VPTAFVGEEAIVFGELTAEASFTRMEEEVRRFWRRHEVIEAFCTSRRGGPPYLIYQQPLFAAGQSQADQIRLLASTDLLARYRIMRGDAVHFQMGWVCDGLPVEVAVERSLGPATAGYNLAQFNAACRDAALDGVQQGEALAERLGVWCDPDDAYLTLTPQSIGMVWGALRRLWDEGRLRQERLVAPICPRCVTPLSATEATRRAVEIESQSVWVQLPWNAEPNAYLLAWTSAPWTLVGMVALAAHPDADYVVVEVPGREDSPPDHIEAQPVRLLLAETALERALPSHYHPVRRVSGRSLRGMRYHPPFTFRPAHEAADRVILDRDVPLDQGSGLRPVTPAFDGLSLAQARAHKLPVPELLDDWGGLDDSVTPWRGLSPLDADPLVIGDLRTRGLLFRADTDAGLRALCPYCATPLLPLARSVWLLETASGPWILGRDRAWGVPLPIWTCGRCGQEQCVAGLDDLARRAGMEANGIVPHRPEVDQRSFACEACGGTMRRVAAVVDAAFVSAVLPWSATPHPGPADLAVGLGDRHLGWLGDLTEAAALLRGSLAWEQALALPELEPETTWDAKPVPPADSLRWAAYTGATPNQAEREFLRPLWRLAVSIFGDPSAPVQPEPGTGVGLLDRWLLARFNRASAVVTDALEACQPQPATAELETLVGDISDWYLPHRPGGGGSVLAALSRLLAPFVPHLAEAIHRQIGGTGAESVHLATWPVPDPMTEEPVLLTSMTQVRRLAALGEAARARAGIDPDLPLRQALFGPRSEGSGESPELGAFEDLLAQALGAAQIRFAPDAAAEVEWRLALNPHQVVERDVAATDIEAALANLEPGTAAGLASQLGKRLSISLQVAGKAVTLLPDEVSVTALARQDWAAAADDDYVVVLKVG
jgi:isoleucyl-tRNA synthetase